MKLFFILVVLIAAFAVICSAGRSRTRTNRQRTSKSNRPSTHSNPPSPNRANIDSNKSSPIVDRKSGRHTIRGSDKNPNNNWTQKSNKNPKSVNNKNSKINSKVDLESLDNIDFSSSSEMIFESDYCNMHCENNFPPEKHIGCNPNHNFAPHCNDTAELVEMTDDLKQLLVDLHNENRNFTASGGKACHMATMQWDEELAYLATLNVIRCEQQFDNCHNTEAFKSAGQIKALFQDKLSKTYDDSETLTELVNLLFLECSKIDQSVIDSNPEFSFGLPQDPVAALVADRNTHLGCAAATYKVSNSITYMMVCNYATQGQIGRAIYTGCGEKDPKCTSNSERLYSNLCPLDEEYYVNN